MKNIFLSVMIIFFKSHCYTQVFNDTIITKKADTIFCTVTYVNEYNIIYEYNPKKKLIKTASIFRALVSSYTVKDSTVVVLEKQEIEINTPGEKKVKDFKEENGIIFHRKYDSAPLYGNGIFDLNTFIMNNARVYPYEIHELKGQTVTVLFTIQLDSMGYIQEVKTKEEISTGAQFYDSRHLENELRRVILATKKWMPATIKTQPVASVIYLPLKFYLEANRIVLLPSRLSYRIN